MIRDLAVNQQQTCKQQERGEIPITCTAKIISQLAIAHWKQRAKIRVASDEFFTVVSGRRLRMS